MIKRDNNDQIFYDPSGRRWKFSILIFTTFSFVFSVLIVLMINNILTLYSINSSIRGFTDSDSVNQIQSSEIIASTTYKYDDFIDLRQNFHRIDKLILNAGKVVNKNGFTYELKTGENVDLLDKFINDNDPDKIRYSLISDVDRDKEYYEFRDDSYVISRLVLSGDWSGFIDSIVNSNQKKGFSGTVLDIKLSTIDEIGYSNFLRFTNILKSRLGENNQILIIKLPVWADKVNIQRLMNNFDTAIITFDKNTNDFGELGKLNSLKEKYTDLLPVFQNKNYYLDLPTSSRQFVYYSDDSFDNFPISYSQVGELIQEKDLEVKNQSNSLASFVEFVDDNGFENQIYISDSVSTYNLLTSINSVEQRGLRGFGLIDFGNEDPIFWDIVSQLDPINQREFLSKLRFTDRIDLTGEGQVVVPTKSRVEGSREIKYLGDFAVSQKITKFPEVSRAELTGNSENKIALTFDDGPHPIYTNQILDILQEKDVKATFFVIGQNVLQYPEVANRIVKEGHQIANHTYTHPRTYSLSDEEFRNEISATDDIIREVTGVESNYFRIPFSDTSSVDNERDLRRYNIASEFGLITAGFDIDSKDWVLNDKEKILDKIFAQDPGENNQILLHDGGADRSSTVAAVGEIVDRVKASGTEIVPVSDLDINEKFNVIDNHSNANPIFRDIGFAVQRLLGVFFIGYLFLFFLFSIIRFLVLILLNIFSFFGKNTPKFSAIKDSPLVSVIIPAYNEENIIKKTVESALNSSYDNIEILVVNDGSTDGTREILESNFGDNEKVKILNFENSGKAVSVNKAINYADGEYLFSIDADTIVLPDTLKILLSDMTPNVGAIAGNIQVGNDNNLLTKNQRLEYISGQNFDKVGYGVINSIVVVPGALGLWRKKAVIEAGMYHSDTLAEDTDLTIRLLKEGWKVKYNHRAIAITESPDTISSFVKQRVRWMYGTLQNIFKHKDMIFNRKYGWFGFAVIPEFILTYLFLMVTIVNNIFLLVLFIRLIDILFGLDFYFGAFFETYDIITNLVYMFIFLILYTLTIVASIIRDRSNNKWYLLLYIPFNIYVYRQFLWIINIWVIVKAVKGRRALWNHFEKKGNFLAKIDSKSSVVGSKNYAN